MLIIYDHEIDWTEDVEVPEAAAFYVRDILKAHVPDLYRVILDNGTQFEVDLTKPPEERVIPLDSPLLVAAIHDVLEANDGLCLDNEEEREKLNHLLAQAIFHDDKPSIPEPLMRKHLRGGEEYVCRVGELSRAATHQRWGMDLPRTHAELLKHQDWQKYLLEENMKLKEMVEQLDDQLTAVRNSWWRRLWFRLKNLVVVT